MGSNPCFPCRGTCHCRPSAHRTGLDAQPVAAWQREAEAGHGLDLGKRRSEKCRTSGWACRITSAAGCLHSSGMWSAPKDIIISSCIADSGQSRLLYSSIKMKQCSRKINLVPHTRSPQSERCTTCQWALGSLPIPRILFPTTARRSTCLQLCFEKWRLNYFIAKKKKIYIQFFWTWKH